MGRSPWQVHPAAKKGAALRASLAFDGGCPQPREHEVVVGRVLIIKGQPREARP